MDEGATTQRVPLTWDETIRAIRLFLDADVSPEHAVEAARAPEGGLGHDGETWTCGGEAEDG